MRCIGLFSALLWLLGGALPASAQSDLYRVIVAGPGGGPFDDLCRGSDVLIGFNYIAGSTLNTIAGVCQAQNNGVLTGANYGLATRGKDPGNGGLFSAEFHGAGTPRCRSGQAIGEMTVSLDKNGEVENIDATCVGLRPGDNLAPSHIIAQTGGAALTNKHIACSTGDIAIGLIGRSGTLINGVGLQCATFPWSRVAASTPTPTPNPVPAVPHYVIVINPVEVWPQCAPPDGVQKKGDLAATNTATNTSTQVELKQIGSGNCAKWYRLSWPGAPAGDDWVYSAPPNTPGDYTALDQTTLAAAEAALANGH
jgi:hypothetical protein